MLKFLKAITTVLLFLTITSMVSHLYLSSQESIKKGYVSVVDFEEEEAQAEAEVHESDFIALPSKWPFKLLNSQRDLSFPRHLNLSSQPSAYDLLRPPCLS